MWCAMVDFFIINFVEISSKFRRICAASKLLSRVIILQLDVTTSYKLLFNYWWS